MLYVGEMDDILGLTPRARLLIEVLVMLGVIYGSVMCVDSLRGLWGIGEFTWWVAVPLTVFAGALLPFLMHNVFGKRSKMFIDDAGTMVMGL